MDSGYEPFVYSVYRAKLIRQEIGHGWCAIDAAYSLDAVKQLTVC